MKKLILLTISLFSLSLLSADKLSSISGVNLLESRDLQIDVTSKKATVVVFLSAKCPCSNSHIVELKSLRQDYPEFQFLAIHSNLDEDLELSKKYFQDLQLNFSVLQDVDQKWADTFKAFKTPHAFVLSSNGETLYQGGVSNSRHLPDSDRKYLREALEDLKNGKPIKTPEGRTLGCSIARRKK